MKNRNRKLDFISNERPDSIYSEAYRKIATNLLLFNKDKKIKTVGITSSIPSEGKSISAVNLAITIARGGNKVLLIDSDIRNSSLTHIFNLKDKDGLADFLSGGTSSQEAIVNKTMVNNLDFIPRGREIDDVSNIFTSGNINGLLNNLKNKYDYIILDTTPIISIADTVVLLSELDGMILVIGYGMLTKDTAKRTQYSIRNANLNTLGIILNNAKVEAGSDAYHYRYYKRYFPEDIPDRRNRLKTIQDKLKPISDLFNKFFKPK